MVAIGGDRAGARAGRRRERARHGRRVHVEPEVTFALPPASAGCGGVDRAARWGERLPLTVSTVAGQVGRVASTSASTAGAVPLRPRLGGGAVDHRRRPGPAAAPALGRRGRSNSPASGCTGTAQPVASGSWSLDGVGLAPQQLTAATLPQIGGKGEPAGLLGSDVLARFGAVRIDFAAGALVLPGDEGAPLSGSAPYTGPTGRAAGRR